MEGNWLESFAMIDFTVISVCPFSQDWSFHVFSRSAGDSSDPHKRASQYTAALTPNDKPAGKTDCEGDS